MPADNCAKRPKGVPDAYKTYARQHPKFTSRQPRRCASPGGASGKTNNGGKAPTFERIVSGTGASAVRLKGNPS